MRITKKNILKLSSKEAHEFFLKSQSYCTIYWDVWINKQQREINWQPIVNVWQQSSESENGVS
ncbi:hypothetical protein [Gracilinema caldarium]|uniref:Uncharacterized protein n=1 Tax=Gracilinema caldarium (strain ATCC 51460 / DSM 7334 / H1) TaxID=744872 RepID=F8EZR9_GRAC1|nr:hypothetical protein [Gracilinema caldarium]AEJ20793.1 hypothetical protein Spica_2696 [Gracilinema caldarium DSM 7334]